MKIEVVTIGDELLLGFTIDTNAAHLARELAAIGVEIVRRSTVGDTADEIASGVREALERSDGVITTGGLGPTADDMTKPAIARIFGREMRFDEGIAQWLRDRWAQLGRGKIPESNFAQAMIPDGAEIIPNAHGSAPGIWLEDSRGKWVAMLPGVPREMRSMLADELIPRISRRTGETSKNVVMSWTLRTTGIGESALYDLLGELGRTVDGLHPAFLPSIEGVDIRLTSRDAPQAEAIQRLEHAVEQLRSVIGAHIYGEGGSDLAAVVLDMCKADGIRIAVAESCTGGLLGARITSVPGSSAVFLGGVLAYDNSVKTELLGVDAAMIEETGAVSEVVAAAMARGVRTRLSADLGIAITGIAGPGGGTSEKPVGTVWIALDGRVTKARGLRLIGDRTEVRQRAAQSALDLVRRALQTG
ncbi:MAG TPA: competence/damage-inducible protein A [Gemmatimonadaceae bacterium]|nr:competence/damage-inducible protein A [Gemmatimonadaceae bacterium]